MTSTGKRFAHYPSIGRQSVFITGGATGIGAAMVEAFAAQGARVTFVDIAEDAGNGLADAQSEAGRDVLFLPCDVTATKDLRVALERAKTSFGPVHTLINNAANDARHDWRDVTPAYWDEAMALNLKAMFFAIQAALPQMIENGGGAIVNFGSIAWKAKIGAMPAYTTAKAAVHGLTRSFVSELGQHRIRINTLLPGAVLTERQRQLHYDTAEVANSLTQNQALQDPINATDIAAAALFLSADDSAMCTGQELTVDGGWI